MAEQEETGELEVGGVEGESGLDMEAALQEIGEGLGLEIEAPEGEEVLAVEPMEEPASPVEGEPVSTPRGPVPPSTWRKEAVDGWDTLPLKVREEVLKREEDFFKGIEIYKEDAQVGKGFKSLLQPYMPILEQHGVDPVRQVDTLLRAHIALSTAPLESRVEMFHHLANEYGIDASNLDMMQGIDPGISSLQQELKELKSKLVERENQEIGVKRATLQSELETFANDPNNPYFEEVASDIAALLRSKVATNLPDAYSKAVWANPATRAKEQARIQTSQQLEAKRLAQEKAKQAQLASAATLHTRNKTASARGTTIGTMDDTLAETMRAIKARSN
jgi:hypothetical protein